jgi:hypothetical protein
MNARRNGGERLSGANFVENITPWLRPLTPDLPGAAAYPRRAAPPPRIQWHVIGMYAPSFFTGALILRFGLRVGCRNAV